MESAKKIILLAVVGGVLSSTYAIAAPKDLSVKTVSVPAYNIITDTLVRMTPRVEGKRNDFLMEQVCTIAEGNKTKEQVLKTLSERFKDIEKSKALLTLLDSGQENQQAVCVAWMASSLFNVVDTTVWMEAKAKIDSKEKESSNSWKFWKKKETTEDVRTNVSELNQQRFFQSAQSRLNLAQANAELYAVVASNLATIDGVTSWEAWQQQIAKIVTDFAPSYLQKVKLLTVASTNASFISFNVTENSFSVTNAGGTEYSQYGAVPSLRARGVDWWGNGKILGKDYYVNIKFMD
ncbi:hypothetical protein [Citrobacter amalonaticus]|uniref:hypothetical protein n=1 Tax=Citrobacter amalonaticus TaxID=35703 RepID=UPI001A19636A|nr:hypothetical protein [Citrobacter amalonaticus]HDQ2814061.1 hypothetical protein [Citrobacter amalonaticus]